MLMNVALITDGLAEWPAELAVLFTPKSRGELTSAGRRYYFRQSLNGEFDDLAPMFEFACVNDSVCSDGALRPILFLSVYVVHRETVSGRPRDTARPPPSGCLRICTQRFPH